jgi:hypothetical protein
MNPLYKFIITAIAFCALIFNRLFRLICFLMYLSIQIFMMCMSFIGSCFVIAGTFIFLCCAAPYYWIRGKSVKRAKLEKDLAKFKEENHHDL